MNVTMVLSYGILENIFRRMTSFQIRMRIELFALIDIILCSTAGRKMCFVSQLCTL